MANKFIMKTTLAVFLCFSILSSMSTAAISLENGQNQQQSPIVLLRNRRSLTHALYEQLREITQLKRQKSDTNHLTNDLSPLVQLLRSREILRRLKSATTTTYRRPLLFDESIDIVTRHQNLSPNSSLQKQYTIFDHFKF